VDPLLDFFLASAKAEKEETSRRYMVADQTTICAQTRRIASSIVEMIVLLARLDFHDPA